MRFSAVIVTYFVIGATMFGAGVLTLDDTGMVTEIVPGVDSNGDVNTNNELINTLESMGGPITNVIGTVGGGILAAWNVLSTLVGLIFWPITTLRAESAPTEVVVLLGGTPSVAFLASVIRIVRGSA